jgi:predicted phosphodiesterase
VRYLILGDIHGNSDALESCIRSADGEYDQIVCLGDLVGYGADPNGVIEWARRSARTVIRGNHDKAAVGLGNPEEFNGSAVDAIAWTEASLQPENRDYLASLPKGPVELNGGSFVAVHGSPLDEDEYILNNMDALRSFSVEPANIIFFGHTHVQGGFLFRNQRAQMIAPVELHQAERVFPLRQDTSYLINPGSVGQPRDQDPRAAYALYDSQHRVVVYRRVGYNVSRAQERILTAGLPPRLAMRLQWGT